jgi:hypothetical protein
LTLSQLNESAEAGNASELLALRQFRDTEPSIEVQDDLEGVSAPQVRKWCLGLLQSSCRLEAATRSKLVLLTGKREKTLEKFVTGEGETELRRRSKDTSGTSLEEGTETFFLPDGLCAVTERCVLSFSLAGFYLQTSLDDVARSGQVSCRHTSNSTCSQELHDT